MCNYNNMLQFESTIPYEGACHQKAALSFPEEEDFWCSEVLGGGKEEKNKPTDPLLPALRACRGGTQEGESWTVLLPTLRLCNSLDFARRYRHVARSFRTGADEQGNLPAMPAAAMPSRSNVTKGGFGSFVSVAVGTVIGKESDTESVHNGQRHGAVELRESARELQCEESFTSF